MNFLAHLYLSGNDENLALGNFMADAVKGHNYEGFSEPLIQGIRLHRHIDSFTDQHPIVSLSKKRLYEPYHHYAAVIVDVFYDHFLAHNWGKYSTVPLHDFIQQFYVLAQQHVEILPQRTRQMLPYMIKEDWLYSYRETAGIGKTLSAMARRTSHTSGMETAVDMLIKHYTTFEDDFNAFFPELQISVNDWLTAHLAK